MNSLEAWIANERFRLSGRRQDDIEEFGRIANPSGRITVPPPTVDPYAFAPTIVPCTNPSTPDWPIGSGLADPDAWDPDIAEKYHLIKPAQPLNEPRPARSHKRP